MKLAVGAIFLAVLCSCSGSQSASALSPSSTASPVAIVVSPSPAVSPSASVEPSPSPSAGLLPFPTPTPSPIGTPVARRILAPATVLPVGALCSTPIIQTADGNAIPLQCRSGAVNVLAWTFYVQIGTHVMSLGRAATLDQVHTALCADQANFHSTYPEQYWAYRLSAAYYGWSFASDPNLDPSCR